MNLLKPKTKSPELNLELVSEESWSLSGEKIEKFLMLIFYRGLHCPVCKTYLNDLEELTDEYLKLGVKALAISADPKDKAQESKKDWGIEKTRLAYGLTETQMDQWSLYKSKAIKDVETALFCEPALFLISPDQTIYYAAYNSMPFGRPNLKEFKAAIQFVQENDYPARGEA